MTCTWPGCTEVGASTVYWMYRGLAAFAYWHHEPPAPVVRLCDDHGDRVERAWDVWHL